MNLPANGSLITNDPSLIPHDSPQIPPEIYRYAQLPAGSMLPDDLARLRRFGLYTQRPAEDGFFMVRIRIPAGELTPTQLEMVAGLAAQYGRGLVDITVRQNMQLHWVRPQNLASILDRLGSVGLSTAETCGDTARNIVNCPVAGVDRDELFDTRAIVGELTRFLAGSPDYSGLPRKLKITITGCALQCVYPEISDIGIFAVRGPDGEPVFRVRVGGGLSDSPRFAQDLGVIVRPSDVVAVCAALASLFRERAFSHDYRDRLSFTVAESELTEFRRQLEARVGRSLARAESLGSPQAAKDRSHVGIHRQHDGLYYVGLSILGGRTSSSHLEKLAHLAREYRIQRFRTTNTQNIILLDIAQRNLESLTLELKLAGFDYEPGWARKGMLACTGIQFCKLALTETKTRAAELGRQLENRVTLDEPVRISVTGCPNSCGQHHICDIGLEGALTTIDGIKQEAFQVFLGGGVGGAESFGRRVGPRIPADRLVESLVALFENYKALRRRQESFQDFCRRHSDAALAGFLHQQGLPEGPIQ